MNNSGILICTKKQTSPNKSLNKSEDLFFAIMLFNPHTKTTIDSSEFLDPWVCRWFKESDCQNFPDNWLAWTFSHMVGRISKWISTTRFVRSWHFWVFFFVTFSSKLIDLHLDLDYQKAHQKVNNNSLPSANCLIFVPLEKKNEKLNESIKNIGTTKMFWISATNHQTLPNFQMPKKEHTTAKNIVFYFKEMSGSTIVAPILWMHYISEN